MTYEQAALRALAEGRPDVAQVYATLRLAQAAYYAPESIRRMLTFEGPGEEEDVLTAIMQPPRKPEPKPANPVHPAECGATHETPAGWIRCARDAGHSGEHCSFGGRYRWGDE